MIQIKNATKCFGEKKALDNISFKIDDGSVFGLVGSNGAGKSTLLKAILGEIPHTGNITFVDKKHNLIVVSDIKFGAILKTKTCWPLWPKYWA